MKRFVVSRLLCIAALGLLLLPARAGAQAKPSCAVGKTGKPAVITAKEAWDLIWRGNRGSMTEASEWPRTPTDLGSSGKEGTTEGFH